MLNLSHLECTLIVVFLHIFLITESLEKRALDPDENVRLEVVQSIIAAFKKDISAVQGELQIKLLDVVKNRTLDKKVRISLVVYHAYHVVHLCFRQEL